MNRTSSRSPRLAALATLYATGRLGETTGAERHRERAARLYEQGDPLKYFSEIFGAKLWMQQRKTVYALMESPRTLLIGGNSAGKSHVLRMFALGWKWDAAGSMPDEDGMPQGCILHIAAPKEPQIIDFYVEFFDLVRAAKARGHIIAGSEDASRVSVNWRGPLKDRWYMRSIVAQRQASGSSDAVAHAVSGKHHPNNFALIEEIKGVDPRVITGLEGVLSGPGDAAAASANPSSTGGVAYHLSQKGLWRTLEFNLLRHPNIWQRKTVFKGPSHTWVEARIRDPFMCTNRGRYPDVTPDPKFEDFVYALPDIGMPDRSGQTHEESYNGVPVPGHPDAAPCVFRPISPLFHGQVLGSWPLIDSRAFINPIALTECEFEWSRRDPPQGPPDWIGVDAAESDSPSADRIVATGLWGMTCREILVRYQQEAKLFGPEKAAARLAKHSLEGGADETVDLRPYFSAPKEISQGSGDAIRDQILAIFGEPRRGWRIDAQGGGSKIADAVSRMHSERTPRPLVVKVSFAGKPKKPLSGQRQPSNTRAQILQDLAGAINRGLLLVPPDMLLREELTALDIRERNATATIKGRRGGKEKVPVFDIIPKDDIRAQLGRSTDRSDSLALAGGDCGDSSASVTGRTFSSLPAAGGITAGRTFGAY